MAWVLRRLIIPAASLFVKNLIQANYKWIDYTPTGFDQ